MGDVIDLHQRSPYRDLSDHELMTRLYFAGIERHKRAEHRMLVELHYRKANRIYRRELSQPTNAS